MSSLPKVSIVTINYNDAEGLEKTILSVINQTYKNIEFIIIDGGSNEENIDIIKKYEDKISYWISEPDKGVFDAMNKGIKQCTGDWVNFMNSADSFYNNTVIEDLTFDESALIYGKTIKIPVNELQPIYEMKSLKFGIIMACHQAMFFNLGKYREEIYYHKKLPLFAEYELVNRLWRNGYKISYQPIIVANYLIGGLSSQISWEARRSKIYAVTKSYGIVGLIRLVLERMKLAGYKPI